jgi:uncharacterized membrane protein YciS (DUF1049 family)
MKEFGPFFLGFFSSWKILFWYKVQITFVQVPKKKKKKQKTKNKKTKKKKTGTTNT